MKKNNIFCIFSFLVIGMVFMSGCAKPSSSVEASTQTPQNVYFTVFVTPTPAVAEQDLIIGVWRYAGSDGYDNRIRFNADGSYLQSITDIVNSSTTYEETEYISLMKKPRLFYTDIYLGAWSAQGRNSYEIRDTADGIIETLIYDPALNAIHFKGNSKLLLTPYQGDVAAVSYRPNASMSQTASCQVKVGYMGEWNGVLSTGGWSKLISKRDTQPFDVPCEDFSVFVGKDDRPSRDIVLEQVLFVEILKNGTVIKSKYTYLPYGNVTIRASEIK
jgi:hypothetical protein